MDRPHQSHDTTEPSTGDVPVPARAADPSPTDPAPGSRAAGCRCSVLLNRDTQHGDGSALSGFVNPLCPLHGSVESGSELPWTS